MQRINTETSIAGRQRSKRKKSSRPDTREKVAALNALNEKKKNFKSSKMSYGGSGGMSRAERLMSRQL